MALQGFQTALFSRYCAPLEPRWTQDYILGRFSIKAEHTFLVHSTTGTNNVHNNTYLQFPHSIWNLLTIRKAKFNPYSKEICLARIRQATQSSQENICNYQTSPASWLSKTETTQLSKPSLKEHFLNCNDISGRSLKYGTETQHSC